MILEVDISYGAVVDVDEKRCLPISPISPITYIVSVVFRKSAKH